MRWRPGEFHGAGDVMTVIYKELKEHIPFTLFGALTGIAIMLVIVFGNVPRLTSHRLFWIFHPAHVLLSALATAAMFRLHSKRKILPMIVIGYVGSIGIATLSDSLIPYLGEWMLNLPNRDMHLGFIEKWWLVNPLALAGIGIAYFWPRTKFPHAGHVLLSTWASLFHITSAMGESLDWLTIVLTPIFLFFAVWIPCCMSDIIFPLLFSKEETVERERSKDSF